MSETPSALEVALHQIKKLNKAAGSRRREETSLALGVIIANLADAGDIADTLATGPDELVFMGVPKMAYVQELLTGRFVGMDLRGLGEGRIPAGSLLARLRERGVSRVVNAGTLAGLLDTTIHERPGRGRDQLKIDMETQKLAALKLERIFREGQIDVAWLADSVPGLKAGEGSLNGIDPPLDAHDLRAAVLRAREASKKAPVACAWIDNGPGLGMRTIDTDDKLKNLSGQPPPSHFRMLVKLTAHTEHSPLDPPMIGPPTIKWAVASHVSAILIDAQRGVIMSREKTLGKAAAAGIAVIGI